MSEHEDPCVIRVGAQTAVGREAAASGAAVRAGVSSASDHPSCVDRQGEPMVVCRASWLPIQLGGVDRFVALATPAASESLSGVGAVSWLRPIPVLVGLPEERPGRPAKLDAALAAALETRLKQRARISRVTTLPFGHASGLMALEEAAELIRRDEADLCLAGGVDSYLARETLEWLEDSNQLHSRNNSWGFVPGEAAGFCLVASSRTVRALDERKSSPWPVLT